MAEDRPTFCDDLVREALLYAAGELDGPALREFERRLIDHNETQHALTDAVQLALLMEGRPLRPDPAYRSQVRKRCVRPKRDRHRIVLRNAGIALVAGLLLATCPSGASPLPADIDPPEEEVASVPTHMQHVAIATRPASEDPLTDVDGSGDHDMLDTAEEWANLMSTGEHLERTYEEEQQRRKSRHRVHVEFEPSWEGALSPSGVPD